MLKMAELLRADRGSKGLVTCVSGMHTKQGFGLWSSLFLLAGWRPSTAGDRNDRRHRRRVLA